jgi:hypothetical protein
LRGQQTLLGHRHISTPPFVITMTGNLTPM